MARNARDVQTLFGIVAGYDPDDPFSAPVPLRQATSEGLCVGVWEQFYDTPVQEPIRSAVRKAVGKLEEIGIPAEPFHPRGMERVPKVWQFFFGILPARELQRMMAGRDIRAGANRSAERTRLSRNSAVSSGWGSSSSPARTPARRMRTSSCTSSVRLLVRRLSWGGMPARIRV